MATYSDMLANGLTPTEPFVPFELYAGDAPITSDFGVAGAVDIPIFTPLARSEGGKVVAWNPVAGAATGSITLSAVGTAADTVTIDGVAITLSAAPAAAHDALIGASATATAQAIKAVINADPESFHVIASGAAAVLTLTAIEPGVGGNAITLAKSSTAIAVSAATMAGGSDQTDNNAFAIAAQPIPAGTRGPYFTGGIFNVDAINWPTTAATIEQRKAAFDGTPIGVRHLL